MCDDVIVHVADDEDVGFFTVYCIEPVQESDTLAEVLTYLLRALEASADDFRYGCFLSHPIPDVGPHTVAFTEYRIGGSFFYGQRAIPQQESEIDIGARLLQLRERFSKYVLLVR